ncbi:MAG: TonB-dependent receptor [Candidatus Adiutrix sp.]|nr:TonB-dependent receptor [Candidatus Adiutrix sp.]
MSGNWLRTSVLGIGAILAAPPAIWAQDQKTTSMTLDTVVVTATRSEETLREVTSSVTVIDEKDIKKSTANTMSELLSQNGFFIQDQGSDSFVQVRGMRQKLNNDGEVGNQVLVLLNGRRIGITNVKSLGLANIQRIEIIRGPSAVQYGPSAMGGVVNIITKRGTEDTKFSMEAGLSSYDGRKESLGFSTAKNGFDIALGLTERGRDDYDIKGGDRYYGTEIDSDLFSNVVMGYTFNEKHRIGLDFAYSRAKRSGSNSWSTLKYWWTQPEKDDPQSYTDYTIENKNLALVYEGATEDNAFKWGASYGFGTDTKKSDLAKGPASGYGPSHNKRDADIKTATAHIGYDDTGLFSMILGFDYANYDIDQHGYSWAPNAKYKDTAGYFSGKLRLLDDMVIISAGGRYDNYKVSADANPEGFTAAIPESADNNFAPSVGIAVLPTDWLKLRVNYAEGFMMATPAQLAGGSGNNYIWLGNSGLKPEKTKTFELGADLSGHFWEAGLTYFHTDYKNMIKDFTVAPNTHQYRNIDAALLSGLELSGGVDFGAAFNQPFELRPYASLTYMIDRENKDPATVLAYKSDKLPLAPEFSVAYGVTFSHPDWGFRSTLNASYFTGAYTPDYRASAASPYGAGVYTEIDSVTVVDLSLEKTLFDFGDKGILSLRGEINNMFDSRNEMYLDYPGPGRNFYLGLKYDYM